MKIAVVSDTHSLEVPEKIINDLKTMDLIVHAGDFCSIKDLERFSKIKEFKAVYGNMDDESVRKKLPEKIIFDIEGFKIGVYHGDGAPKGMIDRIKARFVHDKVDVIIFGHSHVPMNEKAGNILFFNPGSLTDTVRAPYRSYGILQIQPGKIVGKVMKVD